MAQVTLGAPHKRSLLVWEMLADNHSLGVEPYKNPTRAKEARVGHPADAHGYRALDLVAGGFCVDHAAGVVVRKPQSRP